MGIHILFRVHFNHVRSVAEHFAFEDRSRAVSATFPGDGDPLIAARGNIIIRGVPETRIAGLVHHGGESAAISADFDNIFVSNRRTVKPVDGGVRERMARPQIHLPPLGIAVIGRAPSGAGVAVIGQVGRLGMPARTCRGWFALR